MKRTLVALLLVVLVSVGTLVTYQASASEQEYRALLTRGDAALHDEQTFAAIEAYSGAIALRPDSMLAHLRRGETYQRRGELESAAKDFQAAATLDPTATRPLDELGDVKYQQQLFQRAAEAYRQCLRLDDRAPRVSYKLALAHYRDGNVEGALAALADALRVDDRMAEAYYLQGLCFREQRRGDPARLALEKAVALSPGLIPAREELADLYGAVGRHVEELEHLQVLAGLDRAHIERHVAIGLAHARWSADPQETATSRASHADLAVLTLRSALERTPDQPLIYAALGRVWLEIAQARDDRVALNKALQALEHVAFNGAAPSDVLTWYGRALLESGRVDAAERALQHATQRYPVDPEAFLMLASAAEHQHHLDVARQALIDFGALATDDPDASARAMRIATLSTQLKDFKTAAHWWQRALTQSPSDGRLFVSLADAQLNAGDRSGAEATITRGLDKVSGNAALLALARRAGMVGLVGPGRSGGPDRPGASDRSGGSGR